MVRFTLTRLGYFLAIFLPISGVSALVSLAPVSGRLRDGLTIFSAVTFLSALLSFTVSNVLYSFMREWLRVWMLIAWPLVVAAPCFLIWLYNFRLTSAITLVASTILHPVAVYMHGHPAAPIVSFSWHRILLMFLPGLLQSPTAVLLAQALYRSSDWMEVFIWALASFGLYILLLAVFYGGG